MPAYGPGRIVVEQRGPKLRLHGQTGGIVGDPGDGLPAKGAFRLEAVVSESGTPGRLSLVGNGAVLAEMEIQTEGQVRLSRQSARSRDGIGPTSAPLTIGGCWRSQPRSMWAHHAFDPRPIR